MQLSKKVLRPMYAKLNLISLSREKHQKTILKLDSTAVKESIRK